ncbi:isochorismatase family protein [Mariniflexile gromovii]|uniref:isochorismatase family protein n=1 Tax=Mariniflexile gromovii TaxID=362523 RepID=UPI0021D3F806|nr:isochorismatase family protein [Mariniflexile gromovii]
MKPKQENKKGLIIVDPFNDFLSEGGKLWDYVKDTVITNNVVDNLSLLLKVARKNGIKVFYAPHRNTLKCDYIDWNFLSPSQEGSKNAMAFEKDSWGGPNSIPN